MHPSHPASREHAAAAHTEPPTSRPCAPTGLSSAWHAGQDQTSNKIITWPDYLHLQAGEVHDGKYSWPDCSRVWRHCTRYSRHLESERRARWPVIPGPSAISARAYVVPLLIHSSLSFCATISDLEAATAIRFTGSASLLLVETRLFVLLNRKSLCCFVAGELLRSCLAKSTWKVTSLKSHAQAVRRNPPRGLGGGVGHGHGQQKGQNQSLFHFYRPKNLRWK